MLRIFKHMKKLLESFFIPSLVKSSDALAASLATSHAIIVMHRWILAHSSSAITCLKVQHPRSLLANFSFYCKGLVRQAFCSCFRLQVSHLSGNCLWRETFFLPCIYSHFRRLKGLFKNAAPYIDKF